MDKTVLEHRLIDLSLQFSQLQSDLAQLALEVRVSEINDPDSLEQLIL